MVGNQYATFSEEEDYAKEIAPCRTFAFLHELEPLLAANLIKGGDLDNAIVVAEKEVSDAELERLARVFDKRTSASRTDTSTTCSSASSTK